MGFGRVWSESWKNYKVNAGSTSKIMVWYYLLPLFIFGAALLAVFYGSGLFQDFSSVLSLGEEATLEDFPSGFIMNVVLLILLALVGAIAFFFLSLKGYSALIAGYLKRGRFSADEALENGKKTYWRFIGSTALLGLIALGVELAVIIGLIFSVMIGKITGSILLGTVLVLISAIGLVILGLLLISRLLLSLYILTDEDVEVWKSLGLSWNITKERSWAMLGYLVFVYIFILFVMYGLMFIVALFFTPFINMEELFLAQSLSTAFVLFELVINIILQPIFALILTPWILSFFREVYAEYSIGKSLKRKRQL